jgi:hypothetical protein
MYFELLYPQDESNNLSNTTFISFAHDKTKIFDYSLAALKHKKEISEDIHMDAYLEPLRMHNTIFF